MACTKKPKNSIFWGAPYTFINTLPPGLVTRASSPMPRGMSGLKDIRVETITEELEFQSGQQLWDWLTNSNPIVERVLAALSLTNEQRAVVQRTLDDMVRKRSGGSGPAVLTNPINIGIGTK